MRTCNSKLLLSRKNSSFKEANIWAPQRHWDRRASLGTSCLEATLATDLSAQSIIGICLQALGPCTWLFIYPPYTMQTHLHWTHDTNLLIWKQTPITLRRIPISLLWLWNLLHALWPLCPTASNLTISHCPPHKSTSIKTTSFFPLSWLKDIFPHPLGLLMNNQANTN